MNVNVYYLTWDEDREERNWDKQDIKDGDADPDDLEYYRPVLELRGVDDLDKIWDAMNRGPFGYLNELDELKERSICVGDLITVDGEAYIIRNLKGFVPVSVDLTDAPEPEMTTEFNA